MQMVLRTTDGRPYKYPLRGGAVGARIALFILNGVYRAHLVFLWDPSERNFGTRRKETPGSVGKKIRLTNRE